MVKVKEVLDFSKDLADRGVGIDADGVYGTQCVDLPNYISHHYFGKWLWGNAIDLLNSAAAQGFYVKYDAPDDINPKAGDVFVMDVNGHPYGHTGIVIEDSDGYTIKTIEQNIDGNWDALQVGGPARYHERNFTGIVGWFRFPYEDELEVEPMQTGWIKDATGWWYQDSDGNYAKMEWRKINDVWYRFGEDGYLYENRWFHDGDNWYWLKDGGAMATGWVMISNKWYYFDNDGRMVEGWVRYFDKWYYLKPVDGDMVSREVRQIDGDWYYFNENGERLERAEIVVGDDGKIQFEG